MQYINARQTTMVRLGKLLPYKRNKKKRRSRKKKKKKDQLLGGNSDSQSCVVDYFPIATCRVVFSFLLIHHDWHLRSLVFRVSRSPLFSGYLVLCTVFWCCIMVLEEPCCVHVHKQDNKNISDRLTAFHQNTPTQLVFFFLFSLFHFQNVRSCSLLRVWITAVLPVLLSSLTAVQPGRSPSVRVTAGRGEITTERLEQDA